MSFRASHVANREFRKSLGPCSVGCTVNSYVKLAGGIHLKVSEMIAVSEL